jgi:hypothetical protein
MTATANQAIPDADLDRLIMEDLADKRRAFPCGLTPLKGCDYVRPDPEHIRDGKIFMRSTNLSHCGSWLTIEEYLELRKRPYRSVGIWNFVPEDDPAANHIAGAYASPHSYGARVYELEKKVDATVALLRRARRMIDQEADNRAAAGLPDSDYERAPVELLADIDAALAKVAS